ncbi:MAG TPA: alpha/beta hydrolase [Leptospiraceae bacterium]|nr:alpha/beta hydrolase [Leptospiraceae bacterium]
MPQQKTNPRSKTANSQKSSDSKKTVSAANTNKPEEKKNSIKEKSIKIKETFDKTVSVVKTGAIKGATILHGVVGDALEENASSLARKMQFYKGGKPINLTKEDIIKAYPKPTSKICILVHGLACDEMMWNFPNSKENYGNLLQKEMGYTPFYLRYNSGLHISENGKHLSTLIHTLFKNYPTNIKELILIGHSMGGLVVRSACYYGDKQNVTWIYKIRKVFFLGSPHLGAPLEKFGNVVTNVLEHIPNTFVKMTKDVINLRSAGIKDLRYGYLLDEDWKGKDPDTLLKNSKNAVPLLEGVSYYIISGTVTEDPESIFSVWFGDALVRKPSVLGKDKSGIHTLPIPEENHKEFPGLAHLTLMHDPKVYEQIKEWNQ